MDQIDPLKLVRNSATLEAYRQNQRAVRAAAQPWLTIGLVAVVLQIGLFLYALFHDGFRDLGLLFNLLVFASGLSFGVAGIRAWLYRRSHPFELPEAPSALRWR
ncbi:MAG TPA: hypothetical protein VFE10_11450 [Phenylobacterium sp.]|jgi:hypothetical protein|nr:hypothetical protein [Phenylobacterium sp.]